VIRSEIGKFGLGLGEGELIHLFWKKKNVTKMGCIKERKNFFTRSKMKNENEKSMCELLGVGPDDLDRVIDITNRGIAKEEELLNLIDSPDLIGLPSRNKVRVECYKRIVEGKDYLITYLELEIDRLKRKLDQWEEGTDQ
jgi:hypothetical protein